MLIDASGRLRLRMTGLSLGVLAAFLILCGCLGTAVAQSPPDEDEPLEVRPPAGLLARYEAIDASISLTRIDDEPVVLLSSGETPDPRLPAGRWRVKWTGQIESITEAEYRFNCEVQGRLVLRIDGKTVLDVQHDAIGTQAAEPISLTFGWHAVEIEFAPAAAGARLQLFWECELFAREPIPATAWALREAHPELIDAASGLDRFTAARLMVEEHSCVACHRQAEGDVLALKKRAGPRLARHSDRLNAAWVADWLANPQAVQATAVMPRMFPDNEIGHTQRLAVAALLSASEAPSPVPHQEPVAAAEQLYWRIGCAVCHEKQGDRPERAALGRLSDKLNHESLVKFLQKPGDVDPAGRMPAMNLSAAESEELATWLLARDPPMDKREQALAPEPQAVASAFAALSPTAVAQGRFDAAAADGRLEQLGRATLTARRCNACHELAPELIDGDLQPAKPLPDFAAIAASVVARRKHGDPDVACLAPRGGAIGSAPVFGTTLERRLAGDFLADVAGANWTSAPSHEARVTLARFNCLACHQRNTAGGLSLEMLRRLEGEQTEQAAELIAPPSLTGITHKLRPKALAAVLQEGARARPWMGLRMPHFAPEALAALPGQLAVDEGHATAEAAEAPSVDIPLAEAGRTLMGSAGFGCTKCHDMLGHKSSGTRGPDLAGVSARIERGWYERWMTDPQRIQPGTRMPTVFFQGQSPYKQILDGDPARQREAMWQYLLAANELPLPEGTLAPTETLAADELPGLLRTFLPELSPRSFAVRGAEGVHVAFDIAQCRLAYAWHGDFLDPAPAWSGRGGRPANLLGTIFWRAPAGFPWAVSKQIDELPDFAARAADTELGATPPEDFHVHPSSVHFHGYRRLGNQYEWSYEFQRKDSTPIRFTDSVTGWRSGHDGPALIGLQRHTRIQGPAGDIVWLNVAASSEPPQQLTEPGSSVIIWKVVSSDGASTWYASKTPDVKWVDASSGDEQHRSLLLTLPLGEGGADLTLWSTTLSDASKADEAAVAASLRGRIDAAEQGRPSP